MTVLFIVIAPSVKVNRFRSSRFKGSGRIGSKVQLSGFRGSGLPSERFKGSAFNVLGYQNRNQKALNLLYETTLKANRRTAEYRISNVEGWFRFAQSFLKWTVRQRGLRQAVRQRGSRQAVRHKGSRQAVRHKGSRQAEFIYSTFDVH
jgi:hypothetical protein